MSITDELLEERMKRATLLVPSVPREFWFMWEQLVCFVVGLRFLQLMTIFMSWLVHHLSSHLFISQFFAICPVVRLAILLLPPRPRGLLGAPLRSVPPGCTLLPDWAFLVELRRFSGNGRCHWI